VIRRNESVGSRSEEGGERKTTKEEGEIGREKGFRISNLLPHRLSEKGRRRKIRRPSSRGVAAVGTETEARTQEGGRKRTIFYLTERSRKGEILGCSNY